MKMPISEFKKQCTAVIKEMNRNHVAIEITNHQKTVAIVKPAVHSDQPHPSWGSMKGTILAVTDDFNEPLGDSDWEAAH